MNILVAGGAGYIGSHTVKELVKHFKNVVVYDDLSSGHKEAIDKKAKFVKGSIGEFIKLNNLLKREKIDAVIDFAGSIQVGESVKIPGKYIYNNVCMGTVLLDAMVQNKITNIVYSSSAGVYGEPEKIPIREDDLTNPVNTYGETKLIFEKILMRYYIAYGINYCALRYFNAAGASKDGSIEKIIIQKPTLYH
jgi:UDP-glucose 4-epimerase